MDAALAMSDVGCGMADVGGGGASAAPMLRLIGGDERRGVGGAAHGGGGSGKRARRRAGVGGRAVEGGKTGGEREWNAAVYLTAYPVPGAHSCTGGAVSEFVAFSGTVATKDKADRAHQVRDHGTNLLTCAADLEPMLSRPRRYPAHQMTSRGVAFDSAFDELHRRQTALGEMGIGDIGGNWARRSVGSVSGITLERAAAEAAARGKSLREMTRQRLNEPSMGDSEKAAEDYAKRQIEMFKAGTWAPSDAGGAK